MNGDGGGKRVPSRHGVMSGGWSMALRLSRWRVRAPRLRHAVLVDRELHARTRSTHHAHYSTHSLQHHSSLSLSRFCLCVVPSAADSNVNSKELLKCSLTSCAHSSRLRAHETICSAPSHRHLYLTCAYTLLQVWRINRRGDRAQGGLLVGLSRSGHQVYDSMS